MFTCVLSCVCVCVFFLTTGTRWVILYSNLGWLVYFKEAFLLKAFAVESFTVLRRESAKLRGRTFAPFLSLLTFLFALVKYGNKVPDGAIGDV